MQLLLSDQARLLTLVSGCALLWSLESAVPLYRDREDRLRRALPNIALTVLLIFMSLALSFASASLAAAAESRRFGLGSLASVSSWAMAVLGIVALDLFAYLAHVLLHKIPVGWRFHRVHHSDRQVDVTTAFRQHPGETLWRMLWQLLAIAVFGIPLWVVLVYLVLSALNAQLEHANIRVNEALDRILRLLFVTPNMHKTHHSREQQETDTNYSNIFSFWDRLFGTYTPRTDFQKLRYGLDGFDDQDNHTFPALLRMPFWVHG